MCSQFVSEVAREGPTNNRGAEKEILKSNVTVCHTIETAEQKEHRLIKPRTKEKVRYAACAAAEVVSQD